MKLKFRLKERINKYLDLKEIGAPDPNYLGEVSDAIADEVMEFLMELADEDLDDSTNESKQLDEKFTSNAKLKDHFQRHCLGNPEDNWGKASNRRLVYYDFETVAEYEKYEAEITRKCAEPDFVVDSLFNTPDVINAFELLGQGGNVVEFSSSCGLRNASGPIIIYFISTANDVTTNFHMENTVSLCVKSKAGSTLSLYPLAFSFVEQKFRNIVNKYAKNIAKLLNSNV